MKLCLVCEKTYGDEVEVCEVDGAPLGRDGPQPDPFIGQMVKGRYRVISKLGKGRLGTVYRAEEVSTGNSAVLKVLHREFAEDETFVSGLRHQASLAATLSKNPNIATIYDCDRAGDGSLFIAMEHLDGRSLRDVIREEGALDVQRALRLAIQIAAGLKGAHGTGFVHGDLRPQNVMVIGPEERIMLTDCEIAGLRDTTVMGRLTRAGIVAGTPQYMAPEQIKGEEITNRTDIYAFGIILYQMLSGVVPFSASAADAVMEKHLHDAPVRLRKLRPEIPSWVERLVMQALEKDAERRQGDMGDVLDQLVCGLWTEPDGIRDGPIPRGRARTHALAVDAKSMTMKSERLGGRTKLIAIGSLLVLAAVLAAWMAGSQRPSASPVTPSPRPSLEQERADESVAEPLPSRVESVQTKSVPTKVESPPASPAKAPAKASLQEGAPQGSGRPVTETQAPASTSEETKVTQRARLSAAPLRDTPREGAQSPDPAGIIDWLLEERSANRE